MTFSTATTQASHRSWRTLAAEALGGTGVRASRPVQANLAAPALVAESLRRGEGGLSADGALVVATGVHTGRSVQDKFVVDEPSTTGEVWWGKINQRLAPEKFAVLKARVQAYLQGQQLFTQDLYAGADPAHRVRVRLVTTGAWQALFARNIFIRPPQQELAGFQPDYVILHAPHFQADPAIDGVRSGTAIALSFEQRLIVIAGTEYAGEIKKSIFTVMNWLLPDRGVLPMHCSANIGADEDVALFFGLSGTGKTTLSSDPQRRLIGDDEHGWGDGRRVQLRGRLLREGDQPLARSRAGDLGGEPPLRHRAGECRRRPARPAGPDRRIADREHALVPIRWSIIPNVEPSRRGGQPKQRGDADGRRVRRDAADRPTDAGAGDVSLPVRLHRAAWRERRRAWAPSRRRPSAPASARRSCRAGRRCMGACWPS